eukprot:758185-Hanusia_phi.AAC.12
MAVATMIGRDGILGDGEGFRALGRVDRGMPNLRPASCPSNWKGRKNPGNLLPSLTLRGGASRKEKKQTQKADDSLGSAEESTESPKLRARRRLQSKNKESKRKVEDADNKMKDFDSDELNACLKEIEEHEANDERTKDPDKPAGKTKLKKRGDKQTKKEKKKKKKKSPFRAWVKGGQSLVPNLEAYDTLFPLNLEWPSLSLDFMDDMNGARKGFPLAFRLVIGTQADTPENNKVTCMPQCPTTVASLSEYGIVSRCCNLMAISSVQVNVYDWSNVLRCV